MTNIDPEDFFTVEEEKVPTEAYFYNFTVDDVRALVSDALNGRANKYEVDADAEAQLGAANRTKIANYRFAAEQFREFASVVRALPDGEIRERPVPPAPVEVEDDFMYDGGPPIGQDIPFIHHFQIIGPMPEPADTVTIAAPEVSDYIVVNGDDPNEPINTDVVEEPKPKPKRTRKKSE